MIATPLGRYTLLDPLGSGSIAEAFRAHTAGIEGFEKSVVVKRLLPSLREDPYLLETFLSTLRPTLALRHSNIAQVLDMDLSPSEEDGHYWVTEHVVGWSLRSVLEHCRRTAILVPIELVLYVGLQTSLALDYAHRLQPDEAIVHGNVSPGNLLFSREGEVKLTDFGATLSLMRRNAIMGFPPQDGIITQAASLSPEQLSQGTATTHSDIFSLGLTLAQCLMSATALESASESSGFLDLSRLRSDLPDPLRQLLMRALSIDPSERIATAGDLHEELLTASVAARLRWPRSTVLEWLTRTLNTDAQSTQQPTTPQPPQESDSIRPSTSFTDASVLVLTTPSELSQAARSRLAVLLARTANGVHWLSPQQLCAVFHQPDGRDVEIAVRSGLALLRTLGVTARTSHIAIDLATLGSTLSGSDGILLEPQALAELAAPLGQAAWHSPGRVIVSQRSTRELRSLFRLKRAHKLGFAIVGSRPIEQASGPFFDRLDVLAWLTDLATQLPPESNANAGPVVVVGSAGLGKTRLLLQLGDQLRSVGSNVKLCIASCPAHGRSANYSAVLALLARLCDIRDGDLTPRPAQRHPALVHVDFADLKRTEALLFDPPEPSSTIDTELTALLTRVVQARCRHCPHVLVLDAAHQVDPASLRVLKDFATGNLSSQALLILLTRDVEALGALTPVVQRRWLLQPLTDATMSQIIAARLRVTEVPPRLNQRFIALAQGNPFVLEELLRQALDQNQIRLGRDEVKAHDPEFMPSPSRSLRLMQQNGLWNSAS